MSVHSFFRYISDLLMVTRPVILIPVWGFSSLGFRSAIYSGKAGAGGIVECWHSASFADYGIMLLFSVSVAAVYIMNQIADIDVDKKNGGMPLIAQGIISLPSAIIITVLCTIVSLLIPLLFHHYLLSLASGLTLLLGYIYSFKPFRFSGRPFADFISNALGYGMIAFGVGWTIAGKTPFSSSFLVSALPYFFLMCGGSISSTLPDIDGDQADLKNTTAVVLGGIPAHSLAMLFVIGSGITGLIQGDLIVLLCAAAALPFYLGFLIRKNRFFMEATYKIGGGLCMIAAFIALPFFIPLAFIVFIATWLYFRIRHGISYPSLIPVQTDK